MTAAHPPGCAAGPSAQKKLSYDRDPERGRRDDYENSPGFLAAVKVVYNVVQKRSHTASFAPARLREIGGRAGTLNADVYLHATGPEPRGP